MNRLAALSAQITAVLGRLAPLLPLMLRVTFAATLLGYYWKSAATKLLDRAEPGLRDWLTLESGVYAQIFPRQFEAAGYDPDQLSVLHGAIAAAGTLAELLLPLLIIAGLMTRLAALGMIGFVVVQTATDVIGHGAMPGALFDGRYQLLDERLLWCALLATLVVTGAGALSFDRLIAPRLHPA
ncbi:DoxX family membrane protein [Sagittula salina]|uniref:DoxX family membrane protein n=1 Tax=Sagittula salina TaxID=2820268 RepID=A0A940MMX1_9RHOB|nr:DoxX family membrane protein [Sagittula salina]MBP0481702.1 DoxX family membrane protein [Sagittula salina]